MEIQIILMQLNILREDEFAIQLEIKYIEMMQNINFRQNVLDITLI